MKIVEKVSEGILGNNLKIHMCVQSFCFSYNAGFPLILVEGMVEYTSTSLFPMSFVLVREGIT